jgi:hypothetical protein
MTGSSPTALPATFNAADVEAFLETRVTERNRQRCMRVILNLISGKGETHKAKPGESFMKGHTVTPSDDLDALKRRAQEWLPSKGPDALDRGHGWALNHPIQKLIEYKNHLLGVEPSQKRARAKRAANDDPFDKIKRLKALYDEGAITGEEFDGTKQQLLAQI